jgi:hypothetical protein
VYADWCSKKQSRTVFVTYHATLHRIRRPSVLRRIRRPSRYFAAYSLSVTTNLRHH